MVVFKICGRKCQSKFVAENYLKCQSNWSWWWVENPANVVLNHVRNMTPGHQLCVKLARQNNCLFSILSHGSQGRSVWRLPKPTLRIYVWEWADCFLCPIFFFFKRSGGQNSHSTLLGGTGNTNIAVVFINQIFTILLRLCEEAGDEETHIPCALRF